MPKLPQGGSGSGGPLAQAVTSQPEDPCPLKAPMGNYTVAPGAVALFQPGMANLLTSAFANLNNQDIVPMITSGFRTTAGQTSLLNSGSGPYPVAQVSWHEVGMAIDLNSKTNSFPTIIQTMTNQGLTWGGTFRPTADPVHFQLAPAGTRPSQTMIGDCGGGG
jgi:hypothetical protein